MPTDRSGRVIVNPNVPMGLKDFAQLYFGEGPTVSKAASNIQFDYPDEAKSHLSRQWDRLGIGQSPEQYFGGMESDQKSALLAKSLAGAEALRQPEAETPYDTLRKPMDLLQAGPDRTSYLMRQIAGNQQSMNLDPQAIANDPDWMELEKLSPLLADKFYQHHSGGVSLAEARAMQKFKVKSKYDTMQTMLNAVQKRAYNNELRQTATGDWEEVGDIPDATSPSGVRKGWLPAHHQTVDMINKIGGPEGLNLMNVKQGLTALAAREAERNGAAASPVVAPTSTVDPNKMPQFEGLPMLFSRMLPAGAPGSTQIPTPGDVPLNRFKSAMNVAGTPELRMLQNLGRRVTGGSAVDTNPTFTDSEAGIASELQMVNSLRLRQGKQPITQEQYQDWLQSRRMQR